MMIRTIIGRRKCKAQVLNAWYKSRAKEKAARKERRVERRRRK